jgi:hypothetical protein
MWVMSENFSEKVFWWLQNLNSAMNKKFSSKRKLFVAQKLFTKKFERSQKKFLRSRKVFLLQKTFLKFGVAKLFLCNKKFLLRQVDRINNCWHRKTITATCERSRCAAPHEKSPKCRSATYMRAKIGDFGSPIRERCCARSRMWSNWSQRSTFLEKLAREPRSGSLF